MADNTSTSLLANYLGKVPSELLKNRKFNRDLVLLVKANSRGSGGSLNMANADLTADANHTTDYNQFNWTLDNAVQVNLNSQSGTTSTFLHLQADTSTASWFYTDGTIVNAIGLGGNSAGFISGAGLNVSSIVLEPTKIKINPQGTSGHANGEVLTLIDNTTGEVGYGQSAVSGTATLVAGTATISNVNIKTTSKILLTLNTPGGTIGIQYGVPTSLIIDNTSFVIRSYSSAGAVIVTDTSSINWLIVN